MSALTLAHQVLRVPVALAESAGAVYDAAESDAAAAAAVAASPGMRDQVYFHPLWMERMGWQCDDAVLLCKPLPSLPAAAGAVSETVQLQCCICRVTPLHPSLHAQHWSADLSMWRSAPTVSLLADVAASAWAGATAPNAAIVLSPGGEAEQAYRASVAAARAEAFKPLPPVAAPNPALKTPVKAKKSGPVIMLPPSAASIAAAAAAGPRTPVSLSATLAAGARLPLRVLHAQEAPRFLAQPARPAAASADPADARPGAEDLFVLSLRGRPAPLKATRLVLQPLQPSSSCAPGGSSGGVGIQSPSAPPSTEECMALAAVVKRLLLRGHLSPGAVVDVRGVEHSLLRETTHLRVVELSPDGDVCQVARGTQVLLDFSTPATGSTSGSSDAPASAASVAREARARATQSVHPALQALHSLLLPPLLYPQAFEHLHIDTPKGLLLSGPPGVGKTYSVTEVCRELHVELFLLDGAAVFGGGDGGAVAGAAEETLRRKFGEARAYAQHHPAVLFIDEIDVLCPERTDGAQLSSRIVAQLLSLMDGLENRGQLLIVGATNHPNSLDAALRRPGRFDRELRLEPPTISQRLEILRFYTRGTPLAPGLDLELLARDAIGYVGADLAALVREAAMHAIERHKREEEEEAAALQQQAAGAAGARLPSQPQIGAADFEAAALLVPASSLRGNGAPSQRSTTTFAQVGGLDAVKQRLRQAIEWPLLHAETFQRLGLRTPRGILLYGPPGCAKTTLVRAIASSTSAAFLALDTAQLYSCYVGEAERVLRGLFSRARANRPCVLFLDEIDAMVHKRSMAAGGGGSGGGGGGSGGGGAEAHSLESRILSTLLNEMDGMVSSSGVLVVAATNRLDMLDEALLRPGRFDSLVHVPPPDAASRLQILHLHAGKMLAHPEDDHTRREMRALAERLEGYTGADIANLCREAALAVLRNDIHQPKVLVSDLCRAAELTPPSLTPELMLHYANLAPAPKAGS